MMGHMPIMAACGRGAAGRVPGPAPGAHPSRLGPCFDAGPDPLWCAALRSGPLVPRCPFGAPSALFARSGSLSAPGPLPLRRSPPGRAARALCRPLRPGPPARSLGRLCAPSGLRGLSLAPLRLARPPPAAGSLFGRPCSAPCSLLRFAGSPPGPPGALPLRGFGGFPRRPCGLLGGALLPRGPARAFGPLLVASGPRGFSLARGGLPPLAVPRWLQGSPCLPPAPAAPLGLAGSARPPALGAPAPALRAPPVVGGASAALPAALPLSAAPQGFPSALCARSVAFRADAVLVRP